MRQMVRRVPSRWATSWWPDFLLLAVSLALIAAGVFFGLLEKV
jgi:hypothetical protein